MKDLSQMNSDMRKAWNNTSIANATLSIALGQLRSWSATETAREDITEFLKNTADLPPEAAVQLTATSISLLVDDDDNVLAFR